MLTCNDYGQRQLKMIHRLHCTLLMSARSGLSTSNCNKCGRETDICGHMLWKCLKIQIFQNKLKEELEALTGLDLDLPPVQCVLAARVSNVRTYHKVKLIGILLYIARNTSPRFWIHEDIPTLDNWYREVTITVPLDKLTYSFYDNMDGVRQAW